jgi:hypothetical protein
LPFALHTSPGAHLPQSIEAVPQALLICPHSLPAAAHSRAGSGGPHRLAIPAVAHDSPVGHAPQSITEEQPSETKPHSAFCAAHAALAPSGTQVPPAAFGDGSQRLKSALQVKPAGQSPQSASDVRLPQPSQAGPHSKPSAAQVGLLQATHLLVFGSHSELSGQSPQSRRAPQVLRIFPHSAPRSLHVTSGSMHLC